MNELFSTPSVEWRRKIGILASVVVFLAISMVETVVLRLNLDEEVDIYLASLVIIFCVSFRLFRTIVNLDTSAGVTADAKRACNYLIAGGLLAIVGRYFGAWLLWA